ncbi:MAG TPA: AraC family transcriptional regulator [Clostridiaceae bacterium]
MAPFCFTELINKETNKKVPYNLRIQEYPHYFITHRHNFIEFSYVIKGIGSEVVNNKKHILEPGVFSLILPYQVHTLYSEPDNPITFYVGAISMESFFASTGIWSGLDSLLFKSQDEMPVYSLFQGDMDERMKTIFSIMLESFDSNNAWSELMFRAKLLEALVLFDRNRTEEDNLTVNIIKSSTDIKSDFWSIVYYVQTNYNENINLKKLSAEFHLSTSYISTSFKKHIGENYLDFLNGIRIQNACALLTSTNMTITDVGYEVGYESYAAFYRMFYKRMGISAKVYKDNNK